MKGENSKSGTADNKGGVAAMVAGGVVLGTISLTLPFIALPTRKGFLPFMATPGKKVRKALEFIAATTKSPSAKRGGSSQRFLDLGSGDGEAIYQAVQVVGADDQRARSSFECADFWKRPVDGFSTILIFGVQPLMLPLSLKLAAECKPGTYIMSYRFRLPLGGADNDAETVGLQAEMVYEEDEMRIYETR